jgi:hypothetical protein
MSDDLPSVLAPIQRDKYGYAVCTPERPWTEADGTPVSHTGAHEIGEQENGYPGGDIVTYRCDDCGAEWRQELPQ